MKIIIEWTGYITAAAGVLICLVAALSRLGGNYFVAGFESITLFIGGMALMMLACLIKLYLPGDRGSHGA